MCDLTATLPCITDKRSFCDSVRVERDRPVVLALSEPERTADRIDSTPCSREINSSCDQIAAVFCMSSNQIP